MKLMLVALISITFAGVHAQKKNCCKPPAFSFEDLPKAKPQPGHGNCILPIQSQVDSVQYYANQGVNMYFSFNYYESFMAFRKAHLLDTTSIGCVLGCKIALEGGDQESSELYADYFNKALVLYESGDKESDFESLWLEAEVGYHFMKKKYAASYYEKANETFYNNFKSNPVAVALHLAFLDDGLEFKNEPYETTLQADSLVSTLDSVLFQNSGVLHMLLHLYEDLEPKRCLEFADEIVKSGPNSGHLVHMPGHAYYYNGLYEEAIEAFKESYLVDSAFNFKNKYARDLNWNYIHNLDFLCQSLAEEGRVKEAEDWSKKLQKASLIWNTGNGGEVNPKLHTAPILINYRLKRWEKAAEETQLLLEDDELEFYYTYYLEGMKLFFDGMNAYEKDHDDTLLVISNKLTKHIKTGRKLHKKNGEKLGFQYTSVFIELLKVHKRILKFLGDYKNDLDADFAIELEDIEHDIWMYQNTDPPTIPIMFEELAADLYEKQRKFEDSRDMLLEALSRKPHSGSILLNLARMYYRNGQKTEAMNYLHQFNEAWVDADKELIEFEKARVLQINLDK